MSTSKSLSNHLKVLEERHRALDEKIIILEDEHTSNEIVNPLKLEKLELKNVQVDSAGTSDYHIGQSPDLRAQANSENHGIDISDLQGRQFTENDFKEFDRILVMDSSNYENVLALSASEEEKAKVDFILNLSHPGSNMSVPDPYFGGEDGFENVYQLLDQAIDNLIEEIKNG